MIFGVLISDILEYHSWNAGPRSCLGRALATYEGIAITTAILQRFDVILHDTSMPYEPLAALNMVCVLFSLSHGCNRMLSSFLHRGSRTDSR